MPTDRIQEDVTVLVLVMMRLKPALAESFGDTFIGPATEILNITGRTRTDGTRKFWQLGETMGTFTLSCVIKCYGRASLQIYLRKLNSLTGSYARPLRP